MVELWPRSDVLGNVNHDPAKDCDVDLRALAEQALAVARRHDQSIVTAESCTAGKLASLFSEVPGAGERFHGGFVVYSKANKQSALGVPGALLRRQGAVCGEVAMAMARGALDRSPASLAVAITGVAGPERDEDDNPIGFVCIAVAGENAKVACSEHHYGDIGRTAVQQRAMADALAALIRLAESATTALPRIEDKSTAQ